MRRMLAFLLVVALVGFAGCASDEGTMKESDPGKTAAKGDCPDCDPHGGSAFEQADMGLRFYLAGDAWQVAFQFKVRNDMAREGLRNADLPENPDELPMVQEDRRVEISDVFLFDYEVLKVDERVLDNVKREVARVRVGQGENPAGEVYSAERLDRHEFALEFELDDLLRPLSETYFNREYPHGKRIEVERVSSLSGLESGPTLYPHAVPRVLTAGAQAEAPVLTPELEAVADEHVDGWRNAAYRKYEFANGDLVFWADGQLWPFYMETKQGYGLLIGQTLVQREGR